MAYLPEQARWVENIIQLETNTPAKGGASGIMNQQATDLADRTQHLKKGMEKAQQDINSVKGMGGFINEHEFGDPADTSVYPTPADFQAALTAYALQEIGITDPLEIFNGTKVTNAWDNHVWQLTNTRDTVPPVFDWADRGELELSIAKEGQPGVVAPGEQIKVDPLTGEMYLEDGIIGSAGAIPNLTEDPTDDEIPNTPFYVRLDSGGANLIARLRLEGSLTNVNVKQLSNKTYALPSITAFTAANPLSLATVRWETPSNYVHHFELTYGGTTYTVAGTQREYTADIAIGTELTLKLVDIAGNYAEAETTVTDYMAPNLANVVASKEGSNQVQVTWQSTGSVDHFEITVNAGSPVTIGGSLRSASVTANVGDSITVDVYDVYLAKIATQTITVVSYTIPAITAFRAFNPDETTARMSWTVTGDESIDSFELEYGT
jgi:hypothetical protein